MMMIYNIILRVEYLEDTLGDLFDPDIMPGLFEIGLNIFLSMFGVDGRFAIMLEDEKELTEYCIEMYAELEGVTVPDVTGGTYCMVITDIVTMLLDNVAGYFGNPPLDPMNIDYLVVLTELYYNVTDRIEVLNVYYDGEDLIKLIIC